MTSRNRQVDEDLYPSRGASSEWVPRQEPVVWGARPGPLSEHELARFARDGFLVMPDLLRDRAAELQAEARRAAEDPRETRIHEPGSDVVRSVFAIHHTLEAFAELVRDRRLSDVARQIVDDDIYVHQSRVNFKPGFDGKEFYWHSDFETWHQEDGMPRMRALSCAVALTEITPHNGPLMLIPGSHRFFVACVGETPERHYERSLRRQEIGVPDRTTLKRMVEAHGIEAPTGGPGTVVLFDSNTLHGSNGNITPLTLLRLQRETEHAHRALLRSPPAPRAHRRAPPHGHRLAPWSPASCSRSSSSRSWAWRRRATASPAPPETISWRVGRCTRG